MNAPKIIFAFLILITVVAVDASAQNKQDPAVADLAKQLKISDSVAQKTFLIMDQYKTNVKKIVADTTLSDLQKREAIDLLIDQKNEKLQGILSADQLKVIVPDTEIERIDSRKMNKSKS